MEDVVAALEDKNPQIKDETCKFLTRTFSKSTAAVLTKAILKQLCPVLIKVNFYIIFPFIKLIDLFKLSIRSFVLFMQLQVTKGRE